MGLVKGGTGLWVGLCDLLLLCFIVTLGFVAFCGVCFLSVVVYLMLVVYFYVFVVCTSCGLVICFDLDFVVAWCLLLGGWLLCLLLC